MYSPEHDLVSLTFLNHRSLKSHLDLQCQFRSESVPLAPLMLNDVSLCYQSAAATSSMTYGWELITTLKWSLGFQDSKL